MLIVRAAVKLVSSAFSLIRSLIVMFNCLRPDRLRNRLTRFSIKVFTTQIISLFLMTSLLTNSTLAAAAPEGLFVSATELSRDIHHSLASQNYLGSFFDFGLTDNPVFAFFFGRDNSSKRKQQQIARIAVTPNGATIREGEQIYFNAAAFDSNGRIIQGVRFNFTAIDEKQRSPLLPLPNGKFEPQFYGNFVITAEAGGVRAQVTVKVKRDDVMVYGKELEARKQAEVAKNDANQAAKLKKQNTRFRPTKINKDQALPPALEVSSRNDTPQKARAKQSIVKQNLRQLPQPDGKDVVGLKITCSPDDPKYPDCGSAEADDTKKSKTPATGPRAPKDVDIFQPIKFSPETVVDFKPVKYAPKTVVTFDTETDPSCPTGYISLDGGMLGDPTTAALGNRLFVFIRGTDNAIYWKYTDDGLTFSDYIGLSGGTYENPRTLVSGGALYVEVTGTDNNPYYRSTTNGGNTWTNWTGGSVSASTTASTTYLGRSYTFVHGSGDTVPLCVNGNEGGCQPSNYYSLNGGWSNSNYTTADDPGQQPGNPPNTGTDGAGSGNFSFSAPVVSLGGRGDLNVNLALNYNSLLWHKDEANSEITYDIDRGFPAPGWTVGLGKMMDMGSSGGAMLEDGDGTRHPYEGVIQSYYSGYSTYSGRTTDGSFIDYTVYRSPAGVTGGYAHLANGTFIYYGAASGGVAYPTYIKDRHGNYMTISYCNNVGPKINNITDDLGRVIQFNYDTSYRLISITGPGYDNTTREFVKLHYKTLTLGGTFSGLTQLYRTSTPEVIDAIYYPGTNTGYWFNDSDSYSTYGMIAKVSERHNMTWSGTSGTQGTITSSGTMTREITYNYPLTASSLTDAPQYTTSTEDWAGRESGVTTAETGYNIVSNPTSPTPRTKTATLPNGNTITQFSNNYPGLWYDGLLAKVETRSSSNQLLSKTEYNYEQGDYSTARLTEVLSTDELGQTTKQTFTYDSILNQIATIKDYGYSTNSYPLLRTMVMTYENGLYWRGQYYVSNGYWNYGEHIFSLLKSQEVYEGDSTNNIRLSKVTYDYDQSSLIDTADVVMYDQQYNPYNPNTINGDCINWEYVPYDPYDPYYGGEYVCTEYEQVPDFFSYTLARGNQTNTTTYANAGNSTGAISYDSTYDITGNVRTTTTNCCQQMSFNYSTATQYSQPDSHTKGSASNSAYQVTESATYDFNTGAMKTATNFNGRTTTTDYDSLSRPTLVTMPTGGKMTLEYDSSELSHTQTVRNSDNSIVSKLKSFFNGRGQPVNSAYLAGTSNWNATAIKYDKLGRRSNVSMPYDSAGAPSKWTEYTYDLLSRVTQITTPDGSTSKTFYNETSRPTGASSSAGKTVRNQDAWGRERWSRTDDFGRLAEVMEPNPGGNGGFSGSGHLQTTYTYDPLDQLTIVTQGDQTRAFAYDSLGRVVLQKLAEQTATINSSGTYVGSGGSGALWSSAFQYDNRSNLTQSTDARGVKTNFSYLISGNPDPLNRLQEVSYNTSTADTTYTINAAPTVSLEYMTTGDKTRVKKVITAGFSEEENTYDTEGRISDYTLTLAARSTYPMVTSYTYDTMNRLTQVRYPAQYGMSGSPRKTVNPSYDQASRLTQLNVNSSTQLSDISYNPMNLVTQLKTGAATSNPDIEDYTYDADNGLLTNQKVTRASTSAVLMDLSYEYNRGSSNGSINGKTGNLTHIVDNLNRNRDRVYEYDALGRLIKAKGGLATGATSVTSDWTMDYAYDRYGNKTSVTPTGTIYNGSSSSAVPTDGLASLSYNSASNRINTSGYEYDLMGNMIRGQNASGTWLNFEYDAAGRLVKIKDDTSPTNNVLETYYYGAGRQRLIKVTSSQTTYYGWGGSNPLIEYTDSSSALLYSKSYVYAGSRLLSTATNNSGTETLEFHHPDRLGTRLVTNPVAATQFEQATLPFGTELAAETSGTTNQRFTNYDRSAATGLDYAVNRSYSAGQGRFTQVDPIGMSATSTGNPQSNNLYAYVENNPIDFTDPSGLYFIAVTQCEWWGRFIIRDNEEPEFIPDSEYLRCETEYIWINESPSNNGGDGGGSGGGGADPGNQQDPPQDDLMKRCQAALERAGLWEKIQSLMKAGKSFFNVNDIEDKPASDYFGVGAPTKGLTLGQFFDNRYHGGKGSTTKNLGGGKIGIYFRGEEKDMDPFLRLHEYAHLAYPVGPDGDVMLAVKLNIPFMLSENFDPKKPVDKQTHENASRAIDKWFRSGCPSLRR